MDSLGPRLGSICILGPQETGQQARNWSLTQRASLGTAERRLRGSARTRLEQNGDETKL